MRIWYAALVLLCCVLPAGCRTNQHIAALQHDNRLKEDEIYRLRWQLEDCQEDLDRHTQTQRSDTAPARAAPPGRTILDRLGAPATPVESAPSELSVEIGEPILPEDFQEPRDVQKPLDGPVLPFPEPADEVPSPSLPTVEEPESEDEAPRKSPPPPKANDAPSKTARAPSAEGGTAAPRSAKDSRQVAQLRIDASATGGYNHDGQPGDDGLEVVIQLLDEGGRPIRAPAEVNLVLLDPNPSLQGDAAHVARWDFTADEVAGAIRAAAGDAGIPLKLVWRNKVPQNEHLHLFVRYTTADGRRLEDDLQLRIRLRGTGASSGWKTAPQENPPPPPEEEDRATTQPEPPNERTRLASRSQPAPAPPPDPAPQPRLNRPQWSPNRP